MRESSLYSLRKCSSGSLAEMFLRTYEVTRGGPRRGGLVLAEEQNGTIIIVRKTGVTPPPSRASGHFPNGERG
jgi:hypothetical protein